MEELAGGLVCPMDVLEDEQGRPCHHALQEIDRGVLHPLALELQVDLIRLLRAPNLEVHRDGEEGSPRRQLRCHVSEDPQQCVAARFRIGFGRDAGGLAKKGSEQMIGSG